MKDKIIKLGDLILPEKLKYKKTKYSYYLWLCTVQKWLRDTHSLHMWIDNLPDGKYGSNNDSSIYLIDVEYTENDIFDTYEGAMEDSILYAFKQVL